LSAWLQFEGEGRCESGVVGVGERAT
jgi:hypothetical protein